MKKYVITGFSNSYFQVKESKGNKKTATDSLY